MTAAPAATTSDYSRESNTSGTAAALEATHVVPYGLDRDGHDVIATDGDFIHFKVNGEGEVPRG